MQPSDAQPPKQEKVGFWAKLFGKKPKPALPSVPPHGSQTPPPQLGNDETKPTDPVGAGVASGETSASVAPAAPAPGADVSAPAAPAADAGVPATGSSDQQKPL